MRARLLPSFSRAAFFFSKSKRSITIGFKLRTAAAITRFARIPDYGLCLIPALAMTNAGNMFAAHKVAATVYSRQHQLVRIDVDADRPQSLIRDPLDPRSLGGDEYPPAFLVVQKAIRQG